MRLSCLLGGNYVSYRRLSVHSSRSFSDRKTQGLGEETMAFTTAFIASILVFAYLVYAVFNPERF
ncbi:MAG: potassium-transporting ATPase subunit F [Elusimicrobia bacterium]|nr:potassium-transporting ATPase subunit F [Elusimicrobiota bacterium]